MKPIAQRIINAWARYHSKLPAVVLLIGLNRCRIGNFFRRLKWRATICGKLGGNVSFGKRLSVSPGGFVNLGYNIWIGDDCHFEISTASKAMVDLGNNVWLSKGLFLSSTRFIKIASNVSIGEYTSIRDTSHSYDSEELDIMAADDKVGTISIGYGAWIGRGVLIQANGNDLQIGEGAVIGANSVVTKSIPEMEIWAGVPARFLKKRHI